MYFSVVRFHSWLRRACVLVLTLGVLAGIASAQDFRGAIGGRVTDESGAVLPYDDPDQLRAGIEDNLATLGVEQLTAVNLRVMDNALPDARFVDQLGALVAARDEGLIGGIGISNISRDHLMRALEVTEIVCVQNFYNLAARDSMPILDECSARKIAFVPFCPLGHPRAQRESILTNLFVNSVAAAHNASAGQVALAWRQRLKEQGVMCGLLKGGFRRQRDLRKPYARRQHADDSNRMAFDAQCFPNHSRIACKECLPAFVAHYHHSFGVLTDIVLDEVAAQYRLHAKQPEQVR